LGGDTQPFTTLTNVGSGTITLESTGTSMVYLNGLTGSATLVVDSSNVIASGGININSGSKFTGKIHVQSGILAASSQGLGSTPITIDNGAAWSITDENSSLVSTVKNPITVSGSGLSAAAVGGYDDQNTGAIYYCMSGTSSLCQYPETINFTGKVTLDGNTQLGINPLEQPPTGPSNTYNFSNLVSGSNQLSAVPNSGAVITH